MRAILANSVRNGHLAHLGLLIAPMPLLMDGIAMASLSTPTRLIALALFGIGLAAIFRVLGRTVGDQQDIARAVQLEAQELREQAHTDPVTGLANRVGFEVQLGALAEGLGPEETLMLQWIDLRGFKTVNDNFGHAVGDAMLHRLGQNLAKSVPEGTVLARFAGDEFLLAVRLPGSENAQHFAARIAEVAAQPMHVEGHSVGRPAAIGVALMPADAADTGSLMQAADIALHHARLGHLSEVRFFERGMVRAMSRRNEIVADLRSALQKDELSIHFQPIIDLATGRIRAFEALLRWLHPQKGELAPAEFIPAAEESGLMVTLGNWIIAQAAKTASSWPADVALSVNLSPAQVREQGNAADILAALAEAGLDPARLELEVTEALFGEDDARSLAFMRKLARQGVRFTLDDFGTGYSSLRQIHRFAFHTIKLDRKLVSGAESGPRSDGIIRTIAEMGQMLDVEIVAKGLETIEQVTSARLAGCSLGQGWHFSRPVPYDLAAILLADEADRSPRPDRLEERRLAG